MRPLPLALAVAVCLAAPVTASAQTLDGFVNADQTIGLTQGGTPVAQLAPGPYTFEVNDTTSEHNFHVQGPGVNQLTGIEATGLFTWTDIALTHGFYEYFCDVHLGAMTGTFRVGNTLRVTKAGTGANASTVTSDPAGITCGPTCTVAPPAGGTYTLTATPGPQATFEGWSGGGCSGTGTCEVDVNGPVNVTATFTSTAAPPPPPPPPPPPGPSARVTGISIKKVRGVRVVTVKLSVVRRTAARAQVQRRGRTLASAKATFAPGKRTLKVRIPRSVKAGAATLRATLRDTAAGTSTVVTRSIRVPR